MQVLKEEVRNRILEAAEEGFYAHGYRGARLKDVAAEAGVTAGLIYTYFENKSSLFDEVVRPVYSYFEKALAAEDRIDGSASERFDEASKHYVLKLLEQHKKLVILMDGSAGTKHAGAKDRLISLLRGHIEAGRSGRSSKQLDPLLTHILATNYTEGLIEIARHYQGAEWAEEMLALVMRAFYRGTEAL